MPFNFCFAVDIRIIQKVKEEVKVYYGNEFVETILTIPKDIEETSQDLFISLDACITNLDLV